MPAEDGGAMERAAGRRVLVCPFDRRVPKIRIVTSQAKQLQGCRVLVRIDSWPANSQYPQVHSLFSTHRQGTDPDRFFYFSIADTDPDPTRVKGWRVIIMLVIASPPAKTTKLCLKKLKTN